MADFIDMLRSRFRMASLLARIIYVNIGVFVVLRLVGIAGFLFGFDAGGIISYVELPSSPWWFLRQPWTIVTYMFAHYDVLHILFNLLWLWWFGQLFLQFFSPRHLTGLYFVGGIGGGLLYMLAYNLLPAFAWHNGLLLGASAAVIAIVVATAVQAPNYKVGLLFFGEISIKWIAIVTIFIDFISISADNAGGHISHIGGALVGLLFVVLLRRGIDITAWFNAIIDFAVNSYRRIFSGAGKRVSFKPPHRRSRSRMSTPPPPPQGGNGGISPEDERVMDEILKKIKESGYGALTDEEKSRLFQASRRRQN